MSYLFKSLSLNTALAQARIYQKQQHFAAAKQLLMPFVSLHPDHVELQQRYSQLTQQLTQKRSMPIPSKRLI